MLISLFTSLATVFSHDQSMMMAQQLPAVHIESVPHQAIVQAQPIVHKNMRKVTEISHGDPHKPMIALTFDDGFDPAISLSVINTLKEKQVKSTFFLKGNWMAAEPTLTQTILNNGNEIGNHSFDHPQFTKLSESRARQEIQDQENILIREHQYLPHPYFRFPYGARNAKMLKLANDMGYTSILWDIDTLDWEMNRDHVLHEALTKAHNGAIILMHLGKTSTAEALPSMIDELRNKGFQLVTLSTLIDNDDAIAP